MNTKPGQLAKALVVLLCLVSWFTVSNHCALAALQKAPVHDSGCCHKKLGPEKKSTVCCKTLQITEPGAFSLATPMLVAVAESNLTPLTFLSLPISSEDIAAVQMADPPARCANVLDAKRCHPAFAPPQLS